jgi:Tfp pilus assembly protein PilN
MPESGHIYIMLVTIKKYPVDYYIELLKKIKIKPRSIEITTTALFNAFKDSVSPEKKLIDLNWLKKNKTLKEKYFKGLIKKYPKIAGFFKEQPENKRQPSLDILVEYLNEDNYELTLTEKNSIYYSKVFNIAEKIPDEHFKEIYDNGLKSALHLPFDKDSKKKTEFILSGRVMEKDYAENAPEEIKGFFSIMNRSWIPPARDSVGAHTTVLPLLSVPIGLALKGLKSVAVDINFLPLSQRLKKKRSKRKLVGMGIAFLILLMIAALISSSINKSELREAALDKELKEYKLKAKNIDRLYSETEQIERSSTAIKNIKESSMSKLKFIEELTLIVPMDGWLSDFSYQASDNKIKLSGYAVSASKLIPIFEESKLFENVKFTSPITTDRQSEKEKFRIEMTVSSEKK